MSRDEKVKGIYGVGVLKKGKVSERYIQKTYSTLGREERRRQERAKLFWRRAKVRDLTNPTVYIATVPLKL
jgi:hypothetical protein